MLIHRVAFDYDIPNDTNTFYCQDCKFKSTYVHGIYCRKNHDLNPLIKIIECSIKEKKEFQISYVSYYLS